MKQLKPILHGRDHAPGGPDPIPGGGGDGIKFDTSPQEGGFLEAATTDGNIQFDAGGTGNDVIATASRLVTIQAGNAIQLHPGTGDLEVRLQDTWAMTVADRFANPQFVVDDDGGVQMPNLPTSDPGVTGAVWNDGGTVVFSGSTAGGGGGGGGITSIGDTTPTSLTGLLKGNGTDVDVAVAGTDYATPAQLGNKVDRDAVEVATARLVAVKLAAGDAQPAFRVLGSGRHEWGPGGATATDSALYRSGVNSLKTDGDLRAVGNVVANDGASGMITLNTNGGVYFGPAFDTVIYRPAAATLQIDGLMNAKRLSGYSGPDISVAANALTVTNGLHRITSNPGAANLSTINGGADGALLLLANATSAAFNIVTGGNIILPTSPAVFAYLSTRLFVFNGAWGQWLAVGP